MELLEIAAEPPVRATCVLVDSPTALYRHFDKNGALLYVGVSLNHMARLCQHRDGSGWFPEIASMTVEWFPNRASAFSAEGQAILDENPKHNVKRPRPPAAEEIDARIHDSKRMLTRRMVSYKPLYQLKDAAAEIGISSAKLRLAEEHGEIRLIRDNGRTYVTGWALLEYMEALERGQVQLRKMPARNHHGARGAPEAA